MAIYCDLCTEVFTAKDEVDNRETYTFEDEQTADLCPSCAGRKVGELSAAEIRRLIDG